jgi:hypothetical protein
MARCPPSVCMAQRVGDDPVAFGAEYAERLAAANAQHEDLTQQFKEVVATNDEAALRGFTQRHGFAYALNMEGDLAEKIVLEAALSGALSIELMALFFGELGGRYIVELREGFTVWGTLMNAEAWLCRVGPNQTVNAHNTQYVVQLYRRTEEVVACLMNRLRFPFGPFPGRFSVYEARTLRNRLRVSWVLRVALESFQSFNVLLILGQRLLPPETFARELSEVWAPYILSRISDMGALRSEAHGVWLREVLLPLLNTEAVIRFREAEGRLHYMVLCALADEAHRRANATTREMATRLHFQPRNSSAERVMQASELSEMIHRFSLETNEHAMALHRASRPPSPQLQQRWEAMPTLRTHL